ncbi:MAG: hypothetical protein KBG16_12775 [Methanospirillum sp.]|nr:hypothetical protein [Methanospirillum sp.]
MWVLGILVECMDDNPESNLQIRVEHLYLYSMVMGGLMADVFIRVENVSKEYRLGVIGHGTLSKDLQSRWAQFWEKEDPNAKIEYTTPGPDINERVQGTEGYIV